MQKADPCICWLCLKRHNTFMNILCEGCGEFYLDYLSFIPRDSTSLFFMKRDGDKEIKKYGKDWIEIKTKKDREKK